MDLARHSDSRLHAAILFAVASATILLSPVPAAAQVKVKYGMFDEDHIFEPKVWVVFVKKQYTANGEQTPQPEVAYYMMTQPPPGIRFFIAGADSDVESKGGPFRTPAEVAAVLPAGVGAWNNDRSMSVSHPVPSAGDGGPATVASGNGGTQGHGSQILPPGQTQILPGSTGTWKPNFDGIGSFVGALLLLLVVAILAVGGLAALFGKPTQTAQNPTARSGTTTSSGPIQTALTGVRLQDGPTLEDLMRDRQRRMNAGPPVPEWECVAPGTWRYRGGPPMVFQNPQPGSMQTLPTDRFAPPPGYEPSVPQVPQSHPVWERPEPPPDFGTVVRGPGGVPLLGGNPAIYGQVPVEPFQQVLDELYQSAGDSSEQPESPPGEAYDPTTQAVLTDAAVAEALRLLEELTGGTDVGAGNAGAGAGNAGAGNAGAGNAGAGNAGVGAGNAGGGTPQGQRPVPLTEALAIDTNPGTAANPTLPPNAWHGDLNSSDFDLVRDLLREPPPDFTRVPNPPSVTTEQMNMDASTAAHSFLNPMGGLDRGAAAEWIQANYQIPPGPEGGTAPPYMDQSTYDTLKELEVMFLDKADAINNFDNDPSNPLIPPQAFGEEPGRVQVFPAPPGTVAAINAAGPWPTELHGTGE